MEALPSSLNPLKLLGECRVIEMRMRLGLRYFPLLILPSNFGPGPAPVAPAVKARGRIRPVSMFGTELDGRR